MKKTLLATAITLALAMTTPTVFAQGGKPPPHEETGNNLSFATKFVPNITGAPVLRMTCAATATPPDASDPPCTSFPGYWCQKTAADWQAQCGTGAAGLNVTANWGANLLGDASLNAGRPIRVEMNLTEVGGSTGTGYVVQKLTPDLEDRFATYGTDGTTQSTAFTVWDSGATLKIERCANLACDPVTGSVLGETAMSAEINSMGNVVYGYNWGTAGRTNAPTAGIYKLTFTANSTFISSAPGAQECDPGNCTFVIINVQPASGGGGRK
jgi:hypothetical protein